MSREGIKEKSQNSELFGDQDRTGSLSEYEFFIPEVDQSGKQPSEISSSGEKKKDEEQKSELVDFFLPHE